MVDLDFRTLFEAAPGLYLVLAPDLRAVPSRRPETGPIEGTGIGLAISKRLAELMGGNIGFTSEPCRGSEFWIELPEPVAERDEAATAALRARRESVLGREASLICSSTSKTTRLTSP